MSLVKSISYGPEAFRMLNGIFAVYKPSGVSSRNVRKALITNLCRDLNQLEKRDPNGMVLLKGSVCSKDPFEIEVVPNYADHELVSGPRYQEQDIRMRYLYRLGYYTSGVFLITVNDSCKLSNNSAYKSFLRKYEVKGQFGKATKNFMFDGIVCERSTFHHIKQAALDRILASIQSAHQSLAYKYSDIDIDSQLAYEKASSGLIKPTTRTDSLIYSIKCTEFNLPHFTLEVHCFNETEEFLAELVHDIGVDLRSSAVCTQLRQIQFGHITLSHALLRKHWTLEHILNNLSLCHMMLNQEPSSDLRSVRQVVQKNVIENMQRTARDELL